MKRWTQTWAAVTFAAASLLVVPATSHAQTPEQSAPAHQSTGSPTDSQPPAQPSNQTPSSATPQATPAAPSPDSTAQPPASTPQTPDAASAAAQNGTDEQAAKKALTEARDSLAEVTKLPAASQLTGAPRQQVTQLISDFNELISSTSNWRASYDKVDATLTSILGSQTADESPSATAGTAGAVGTSGTATGSLDPAIKAKLLEFQTHLKAFERAAGGASPSASSATTAPAAATPSNPAAASPAAASPETAASASAPSAAGTATSTGTAASAAAETGTTGDAGDVRAEVRSHVDAMNAILSSASGSLDAAQVEQLKSHLRELERLSGSSR